MSSVPSFWKRQGVNIRRLLNGNPLPTHIYWSHLAGKPYKVCVRRGRYYWGGRHKTLAGARSARDKILQQLTSTK